MHWKPFQDSRFSGYRCTLVPLYEEQALISAQVYTCADMTQHTETGVAWRWQVWPYVEGVTQLNEAQTAEEGMAAAEQQIVELIRLLVEQAGLKLSS